jgi:hypothetical protein
VSGGRYKLAPYGIWYYGEAFDALVQKLEAALRPLIYWPPNVVQELEVLSNLKFVEGFEDIGEWAERWRNFLTFSFLDRANCDRLYHEGIQWRETFRRKIEEYLLVKPHLQTLNRSVVKSELRNLPEDPDVKEWLQADKNRVAEFKEGLLALIYGLPTAAGFYFLRLCERALRELYSRCTGRDVAKKTWGEILDELEGYYKDMQRPEVLNLIAYLRSVRNRVMHPEELLTQKDAEDLYRIAVRVIQHVASELKRLAEKQ